jgi:thiamine biosynthesis lipoprotein
VTIETFGAMGTTFEVHAPSPTAHESVHRLVDRHEQRFSRFLGTSELSGINDSTDQIIGISDHMRSVLNAATRMHSLTGGLVDIGVGQAVRMWGYDVSMDELTEPRRAPDGFTASHWELTGQGVRLSSGTQLDLGGIAKGWTCDQAVESDFASMVSAGGDLRSTDPSLVVGIVDHKDREVAEVEVGVGALATSSRMKRRWALEEGEAHHLIDPRSMRPAITPITSASVVAATAVEAEAGAKAVLLLGDKGLAWADRQPWIREALAIWHDGSVYATKPRQAA